METSKCARRSPPRSFDFEKTKQLLAFALEEPPADSDRVRGHVMPFVACELLCSELPSISKQFAEVEESPLLSQFLGFVNCEDELNAVQAGYFERIFQTLVGLHPEELFKHVYLR